ncbi:testicular haploid expressed gene protein [Echeneis naucrates]|uniref:testicular haploid expressed gene protein n=1 Tax=Echeneis naucrates TaxID=173247 RepID=UPI00111379ED|nr:testicular haploid expressed gene protein [Echeneis naucrates]
MGEKLPGVTTGNYMDRRARSAQSQSTQIPGPVSRSVYWLDNLPHEKIESTAKAEFTPRWSELCKSKKLYTEVTRSPVWEVSEWALRAVPSKHLCSLAQPRVPPVNWQPDRQLLAPLSRATLRAVTTSRICQLAQPKKRQIPEDSPRKSKPEPMSRLPHKSSAHIELLSTPKHNHPKFEGGRSMCWPVSRAARNYIASQRLVELSLPKERKALFEGYNPYVVSRSARSASPSPRIQQLCLPLPRKCSSK